jgi:heme A synthase
MALAVVVQIGFAGVGAFHASKTVDKHKSITEDAFSSWFEPHVVLGYLIGLSAIVLVLLSLVARRGRIKWSLLVLGLLVLQVVLAILAYNVPALGFLHPINALLILGTLGKIVHGEWRRTSEPPAQPAPAV